MSNEKSELVKVFERSEFMTHGKPEVKEDLAKGIKAKPAILPKPAMKIKTPEGKTFNFLQGKIVMELGKSYDIVYSELPLADGKVTRWIGTATLAGSAPVTPAPQGVAPAVQSTPLPTGTPDDDHKKFLINRVDSCIAELMEVVALLRKL